MDVRIGQTRITGDVRSLWRKANARQAKSGKAGEPSLLLGLTGGIGAGKSTVSEVLGKCGCVVADGDVIARAIVEPGTAALREIHVRFGSSVINDGALNRSELARIVFSDPQALADLNAITHPRIRARANQILATAAPGGIGIYDAAVLLEAGMSSMVDGIIVVTAPCGRRLSRLVERGMTKDQAQERMANQMSDAERLTHADIHVDNSGTIHELRNSTVLMYEALVHASPST
ncbi:MAG: dephospho-CoA kinase [Actinomycetaceae bacterium]|nr:dephospho-CoA kinase [Actinomycetaceae bacterium]